MSTISGSSNRLISKLHTLKNDSQTSIQDLTKDEFIIGDRVYIASNSDKLGTVVFNGATKFSDGLWIGIALDKPFGKNNGVVQGVQYFQCEENHGIFVRSNNLRHFSEIKFNSEQVVDGNIKSDPDQIISNNLTKETEEFNFVEPLPVSIIYGHFSLGDRVYVAGKSSNSMHKNGILRYFGYTKFADGVWAGIELDNPVGKNDGSVNGVRYFSCKPQYGLFALEHKVKKMDHSATKGFSRMDSFSKFGSNESVSSIASNFSSASRTRVRLGLNAVSTMNKFKGEKTSENTVNKNMSSRINIKDLDKTTSAMQNALKEKEQHIEQLMREREIERIDFATATAKIEEIESHQVRNINLLNDQKAMYDMKLNELQNNSYLICQERDELLERLDEYKKKVDDLQFRIEEKNIDEFDLEHKTEENESQIFELNEKLAFEKESREQLENKLKDIEILNESSNIEQIKILENKLNIIESDLAHERNCSKSFSGLLDENKEIIKKLEDRLKEVKSLGLEEKMIKTESELNDQRNISKINLESFSKLLEEKESIISNLQNRLEDTKSLYPEEELVKLRIELNEERNNSKVHSMSKLLEEKDIVIFDLQNRLQEILSLNFEEKMANSELHFIEEKNNFKVKVESFCKVLEEKEAIIKDLNERLKEMASLNLEERVQKLEAEKNEEINNSKSLSKSLEEKDETILDLQKHLSEFKSQKEKLVQLDLELLEEKHITEIERFSKLLEDKDVVIQGLQERLETVKLLNLEHKLSDLEMELANEKNNSDALSKRLQQMETTARDFQESLEKNSSLDLQNQIILLELEVTKKDNNVESLSSVIKEKEEYIFKLQNDFIDRENKLIDHNTKLNEEKNNLLVKDNDFQERYAAIERENINTISLLSEENTKLNSQLVHCDEQLSLLRDQLSQSKIESSKLVESKYEIERNENDFKIKASQFENQINVLKQENLDLVKRLDESENAAERNTSILQMSLKIDDLESHIQAENEQKMKLLSENKMLHSGLEHLKQKHNDEYGIVMDRLESFKSMNQMLESDKLLLSETVESKNGELIVIRDRLLKISQEYETLQESFNENNQRFESEKRLLNDKCRKAEKQLDDHEKKSQFSLTDNTEKRKIDNKDHIVLLKAAKENSEQQISFLNSVIIDREKKFITIQQENVFLREKIKDLENHNTLPPTKTKKIIPPRLYCDTCEIFDSHDTENCTVIDDKSEPSSPQIVLRQVKINAKAPRLYCDICEIFDAHDTPDCQDQQTF